MEDFGQVITRYQTSPLLLPYSEGEKNNYEDELFHELSRLL